MAQRAGVDSLTLSVVVVTYRCADDAEACLRSLFEEGGLRGLDAEVIVVDNASRDGTVERLRAGFPEATVVANDANLGFARANNAGIARTSGRYILLLNPDTRVPAGALAACVAFLEAKETSVGGMSCRVESPDGTLQWECARRLATPWSEICRALALDRLFPRVGAFRPEAMVGWDRRDARPVECLLGAFLLLRRPALEAVGGLDEGFFLMYEEVDLCRRIGAAGFSLWYWPGVAIVHRGGASWRQEKVETYARTQESALRYIGKHYPRALPAVRRAVRLGLELRVLALRLRRKDGWTREHLEMATEARRRLRGRASSPEDRATARPAPRL